MTVTDENDNAPSIIINTLSQTSAVSANVTENFSAGTFVGHIKGNDVDAGKNGRFDCELKGANRMYRRVSKQNGRQVETEDEEEDHESRDYFRLKRMFSKEYNVITAVSIDREILPNDFNKQNEVKMHDDVFFKLQIVCKDQGSPSMTSHKQLLVYVNDVNDNAPSFKQRSFRFRAPEDLPREALIGVLEATDPDAADNARIIYSLRNFKYHYHNSHKGFFQFIYRFQIHTFVSFKTIMLSNPHT